MTEEWGKKKHKNPLLPESQTGIKDRSWSTFVWLERRMADEETWNWTYQSRSGDDTSLIVTRTLPICTKFLFLLVCKKWMHSSLRKTKTYFKRKLMAYLFSNAKESFFFSFFFRNGNSAGPWNQYVLDWSCPLFHFHSPSSCGKKCLPSLIPVKLNSRYISSANCDQSPQFLLFQVAKLA